MRITAIEPQSRNLDRVNVFVDGEFRCGVAVEIVLAAGLRVGETVSAAALAEIERLDVAWKAREAALNLLSYRARSAAELRTRLRRKEFPDDVVDQTVADLVERGFVDDADFAGAFVRDRVRARPRGSRRLIQELRAKGVAEETAREAIEETFQEAGVSELDLARDAARGWARRSPGPVPDPDGTIDPEAVQARKRRLYGFLARRGFPGDVIRTVMDEVIESGND